ncbi:MAG: YdcH family protein [Alphaproteobacteria bacterium]
MVSEQQLDSLKAKHAELDKQIADLERKPGSDDLQVHELKRLKLKIKDELLRCQARD